MDAKTLEKLIKTHLKKLTRSETKTLIQFLDADENFVCGYSEKPKQINFYFQPLYDEPKSFADLKKELKPYLKGKSCLHLPMNDDGSADVVVRLLKAHAKNR